MSHQKGTFLCSVVSPFTDPPNLYPSSVQRGSEKLVNEGVCLGPIKLMRAEKEVLGLIKLMRAEKEGLGLIKLMRADKEGERAEAEDGNECLGQINFGRLSSKLISKK